MKKLFSLLMLLLFCVLLKAQIAPYPQVPAIFNYQGVARNSAGQPLANQSIKVISSIIVPPDQVFGGAQFYYEKRAVTTNAFGLFSIQVGSPGAETIIGTMPSNAIFQAWGPKLHLHTEIELPNSAPVSLGDTKLASVPYALYAKGARPWSYTVSEEVPGATNFTVYPDKDYWNLGLGTAQATEKLHVVGKIRMQDGSQANGFVLTSDANGVATWKPAGGAAGSVWNKTGNKIFPTVTSTDSVGIGTSNPTARLDVAGKFRLRDGSQAFGYNLVSDANGVASWEKPIWTTYDNNIGAGYHIVYPTELRQLILGPLQPDPPTTADMLTVRGGVRLEGSGPLTEGYVLTVGFNGNAQWKDPSQNQSLSYWAPGFFGNDEVIETREDLSNKPYFSNSQFVVTKDMNLDYYLDYVVPDNYPLLVQGSKHGMAIVINGDAKEEKKFISFFDDGFGQRYRGAIEGQTSEEQQDDRIFKTYVAVQTISASGMGLEAAACLGQGDLLEVAVCSLVATAWIVDFAINLDDMIANVGVAYTSGSGDYAEWLEKSNLSEQFAFGDIVSVYGGKISKKILGSGQLMVVSKAPIVLGNVPDEKRKNAFEKVAFMGQVPVKVKGQVSVGDYIVALTDGSGIGYGVPPSKISVEEMNRIVGIAWSASGKGEMSLVNAAVGINPQATNHMIQKQENEIDELKNTINQLSSYLQSKDSSFKYTKLDTKQPVMKTATAEEKPINTKPAKSLSAGYLTFSKQTPQQQFERLNKISLEKVKKIITERPEYLDAFMQFVKEKGEANGQYEKASPEMKRLLTDRNFLIETIKKLYKIS